MTSYGLGDAAFETLGRQQMFLFSNISTAAPIHNIQPPIQGVPVAISLRIWQLGHSVDHSLPSSAEDMNERRNTSTPLYPTNIE
jgi:hypothetical protein